MSDEPDQLPQAATPPTTKHKRPRKPRAPVQLYTDAAGVEYYKAGAAMRELNMNKNEFYALAKEPWFPKKRFEGKKQDLYPVRDIRALRLLLRSDAEQYSPYAIVFSRSSPADLLEAEQIEIRCFGREFTIPASTCLAFQRESEFTFWSLKAYGKVVGSLSAFHCTPEALEDLLTGLRLERELTLADVFPFERLVPFDVYLGPVALDPELPGEEQERYADFIVRRFADTLLLLLGNDYQIGRLYTVTSHRRRGDLVQRWGFHSLEGKSIAPSRVAYVYPLDEGGVERLRAVAGGGE